VVRPSLPVDVTLGWTNRKPASMWMNHSPLVHVPSDLLWSYSWTYLLFVVLDGKAEDALGFVACDHVHLSIEPVVLGRQYTHLPQV